MVRSGYLATLRPGAMRSCVPATQPVRPWSDRSTNAVTPMTGHEDAAFDFGRSGVEDGAMDAPMRIGAFTVDAPPSRPGGAVRLLAGPSDLALLDAVRRGDLDAYGALYERHVAAVRRLARRLTRDHHEADDVVSEVFANTLRAIRRGGGPHDDCRSYLLRATRHTVAKMRTRKDTGRAEPTPIERLDRVDQSDIRFVGEIGAAFEGLPERQRQVLWSTCVEGRTASDLAFGTGVAPGAVASMCLRARRALGRSYLVEHSRREEPTADCRAVRDLMPAVVQGDAATSTAELVVGHLDGCSACRDVHEDMCRVNRDLRSIGWPGLLAAGIRRFVVNGAGGAVPVAAAKPLAALALAASLTVTVAGESTDRSEQQFAAETPIVSPSRGIRHVEPAWIAPFAAIEFPPDQERNVGVPDARSTAPADERGGRRRSRRDPTMSAPPTRSRRSPADADDVDAPPDQTPAAPTGAGRDDRPRE